MEYIQKMFKRTGWISILISVIFAAVGIVLIWKPEETIKIISYVLGAIFIVIGITRIISSITEKGKYDLYNYNMIFGVLITIIGIVVIIYSNAIALLLNIVIGIWIIYTSLIRLSIAIKVKKQKGNNNIWVYILVLALIMLICGAYIILDTGAIPTIIGAVVLTYSIIDIIEEIIYIKAIGE